MPAPVVTLFPVPPLVTAGELAVTATFDPGILRLELLENGVLQSTLMNPVGTSATFVLTYGPLDSAAREIVVRATGVSGPPLVTTVPLIVDIPFTLNIVTRDPDLISRGSVKWLARIINQGAIVEKPLSENSQYRNSPALWLEWVTGPGETRSERLAVYASPIPGTLPAGVMTAEQWEKARGRSFPDILFGVACTRETMDEWRTLMKQCAERLTARVLPSNMDGFSLVVN